MLDWGQTEFGAIVLTLPICGCSLKVYPEPFSSYFERQLKVVMFSACPRSILRERARSVLAYNYCVQSAYDSIKRMVQVELYEVVFLYQLF